MNPNTPQSGKGGTTSGSGQPKNSTTGAPTSSSAPNTAAGSTSFASSTTGGAAGTGAGAGGSSDITQKAAGLVDTVKQQASSQLNAQKERASEGLGSVVAAVRQTSERLRESDQGAVAQYVERAAEQLERFSNHLRDRDLDELMNEARSFARRQPALFVGSSFAVGLVAARFFKASSPARDYGRRDWDYGGPYGGGTQGGYGSGAAGSYGTGYTGSAGYGTDLGSSGSGGYGGTGSVGSTGTAGSTGATGDTPSTRPRGFEGGF